MMNLYKEWHVGDAASTEMIARRYVERFIGCVENITNPKCELTNKEKKTGNQENACKSTCQ